MNELMKIETNEKQEPIISGRILYEFLEIKTPYAKWFDRMKDYGFEENIDYLVTDIFVPNSNGGKQTQIDHVLKLDMAKEISMIQRNEKGKQARQYFIEVEKEFKNQQMQQSKLPTTYKEALIALVEQVEMNERLLEENGIQKQQLTEYEPKVTYYNQILNSNGLINISIIAKDYGKSAVWLNQYLHDKKVQYKQGNTWLLYSVHQSKGYTKSKTYFDERNNTTRINTKWTQAGRLFLYDLLKSDNILPLIEQEN